MAHPPTDFDLLAHAYLCKTTRFRGAGTSIIF
jgi:hypothetical protein